MVLTQRHRHVLDFGVELQGVFAAFAVGAAVFDAAEGGGEVADVVAVDPRQGP